MEIWAFIDYLGDSAQLYTGLALDSFIQPVYLSWCPASSLSNPNSNYLWATIPGDYTVVITDGAGCEHSGDCELILSITAIQENNTTKQLLKTVDVLGSETPYKKNTPLFYLYDDGTVEKRIVIE